MATNSLTQKQLQELLHYDFNTGVFTWKVNRPRAKIGSTAGYASPSKYIRIQIDKKLYLAHRLVWMYVHGSWPKYQLDHINRNKHDNRVQNLRDVDQATNLRNVGLRKTNTSGHKGVSWWANKKKWAAQIRIQGKKVFIGMFDTAELAAAAYANAAKQHNLAY